MKLSYDARWSQLYSRLRRLQKSGKSEAAYRAATRLSAHESSYAGPRAIHSSYRDNGPSPSRFES